MFYNMTFTKKYCLETVLKLYYHYVFYIQRQVLKNTENRIGYYIGIEIRYFWLEYKLQIHFYPKIVHSSE